MNFEPTPLEGLYVITLSPYVDDRGWFARTYCKNEFKEIGHEKEWVQINHSFTRMRGTIRGMHYQSPNSEVKLVRCISGAVWDVAIDLRENSNSFLKWFAVELSSDNQKMMYIPEGFAHGFQALTENCELIYHHSAFYTGETEGGIRFDDPAIGIKWPLKIESVSERDLSHRLIDINFKGI